MLKIYNLMERNNMYAAIIARYRLNKEACECLRVILRLTDPMSAFDEESVLEDIETYYDNSCFNALEGLQRFEADIQLASICAKLYRAFQEGKYFSREEYCVLAHSGESTRFVKFDSLIEAKKYYNMCTEVSELIRYKVDEAGKYFQYTANLICFKGGAR